MSMLAGRTRAAAALRPPRARICSRASARRYATRSLGAQPSGGGGIEGVAASVGSSEPGSASGVPASAEGTGWYAGIAGGVSTGPGCRSTRRAAGAGGVACSSRGAAGTRETWCRRASQGRWDPAGGGASPERCTCRIAGAGRAAAVRALPTDGPLLASDEPPGPPR